MALLFNGSTDNLSISTALIPLVFPFTFACWVKLGALPGVAQTAMGLCKTTGGTAIWNLLFWDNATSKISAGTFDGATSGTSQSAVTVAETTNWHHYVGVFTSAASRTVYLDSVAAAANTTSIVTSSTTITLGCYFPGNATPTSPLNGSIALPIIWNISLAQADVSALFGGSPGGRGTDPRNIQPGAIISFSPLKAAPFKDLVTGLSWTVGGNPGVSADPFNILHQPITHGGIAE